MSSSNRDRYITFDGLDCDRNAAMVVEAIRRHVAEPGSAGAWGDYFITKFAEQRRLAVDDLFFVGSQMNNLYEFFSACGDEEALKLLYQVEQECC